MFIGLKREESLKALVIPDHSKTLEKLIERRNQIIDIFKSEGGIDLI